MCLLRLGLLEGEGKMKSPLITRDGPSCSATRFASNPDDEDLE